jgi:hypothetical protein
VANSSNGGRRKSANPPGAIIGAGAGAPIVRASIDPELIELIAVAHYDSSKFTIKGNYFVEEPGT